ncbi:spore coat protein [Bacillus subtilis]|uniref:spore coat protein n=1 Tax=Bacillus subtilis TaxID=1423 RepID=UPI000B43D42C|nr:spore coat protein [Bacillus subtilis]MEC0441746.1 spore coat protein [Bacillus subtilis]MED3601782.1 spore coat protein [Bacillus subtilis]MED3695993.1 spore coat protein [Bacillus subtilis]OTQ86756.1 spore coat protein [Bacillus subtilis subsp. subtilis]
MESRPYSWVALDNSCTHPGSGYKREAVCHDVCSGGEDANAFQDFDQLSLNKQTSEEMIIVRDSCDIDVTSTDTQVAASIQAALQTAVITIVNLSIADGDLADQVIQDLVQQSVNKQSNRQKLVIENSRNVNVTTTDTDIALSIQILTQTLAATIIAVGIL